MSAEKYYREAFERLKSGTPIRLENGSCVSQNNVAREAGSDSTALKKDRFPSLIAEIQRYVMLNSESSPESKRGARLLRKKQRRSLQNELDDSKKQRDKLASQLLEADMTILELRNKLADLSRQISSSNVTKMSEGGPL
jgi:septal ring factor EnvC (AmiA/AmiB activator)